MISQRHLTQNLFLVRELGGSDWFIDARMCSWHEWEHMIGIRTNKNLPTDTENEIRYSQLLLLRSFLISMKEIKSASPQPSVLGKRSSFRVLRTFSSCLHQAIHIQQNSFYFFIKLEHCFPVNSIVLLVAHLPRLFQYASTNSVQAKSLSGRLS